MNTVASRFLLLSFGLALILFSGCDVIDGPKKDFNAVQGNSNNVVLLEEFTGHLCGFCPPSHIAANEIADVFGKKVVQVGIHSGHFASWDTPGAPQDGNNYTTPVGTEIDDHYGANAAGFPKGMINRKTFNNKVLQDYPSWIGYISNLLTEAPPMGIDITTQYDSDAAKVNISVDIEYFVSGLADNNLVVCITEDSVISAQTYYGVPGDLVEDYVHRHILRGAVTNSTWGEPLKNGSIETGERFLEEFEFTLDPSWNPEHCHVVAYVLNATNKEILQAGETHVIPE